MIACHVHQYSVDIPYRIDRVLPFRKCETLLGLVFLQTSFFEFVKIAFIRDCFRHPIVTWHFQKICQYFFTSDTGFYQKESNEMI